MKKLLFGLVVAFVGAGSAFAHATLAAWDGDFSVLTKDWVTLDLQGNTVNGDGTITIGDRGLKLTRTGNNFSIADVDTDYAVTIILKVANVPTDAADDARKTLCAVRFNGSDTCSAAECVSGSKLWVGWSSGSGSKTSSPIDSGEHVIAFGYRNKLGCRLVVDGNEWASDGNYSSSGQLYPLNIGEFSDGTRVATGLTVKGIAIVDGRLTAAEVAAYEWPDPQLRYARFLEDFAGRIMTWTAVGQSTEASSADGTFALFDPLTGANMTTFTGNAATTSLPGCSESVLAWHGFADGQVGYVAPGLVLRFPIRTGMAASLPPTLKGGFNPLSVGGIIVEAGAASLAAKPGVVQDSSARRSDLGDMSGQVPSWFVINDSFQWNRGGAVTIYGEANFDIAEGRVFECETANATGTVALKANATLRMYGGGTFRVKALTATGSVTLDYSNLSPDRATAFIDGDLAINASTKIALPANAFADGFYRLCSGRISATSVPASITVGGEAVTDFILVGGLVLPGSPTTWTGAGADANWSTPENWSAGVPDSESAVLPAGTTAVMDVEPSDVKIIGEGRLVYVGRLPGGEKASFEADTWTGTVEIRDCETAEDIPFADIGNDSSCVALNGVTAPMGASAAFGTLEIGEGGWTSTASEIAASPAYRCGLTGTGTITVAQKGVGTVSFIGDCSGFAGSVVLAETDRQVAFLPAGAEPVAAEDAAGRILVADGAAVTVAAGRIWSAPSGLELVGTVGGAGVIDGAVNFNGGAIRSDSLRVLDGTITGTPTVDGAATVAAGLTGARVLVRTAADKPEFAIRNAADFRTFWRGDVLCVTKSDAATVARYAHWADYQPGMVTCVGSGPLFDSNAKIVGFDPMVASDTAFSISGSSVGYAFYPGDPREKRGVVLRFAPNRGTVCAFDYQADRIVFGGILVEAGATGWSFASSESNRQTYLGDWSSNAAETWTSINEDFSIRRGGAATVFGQCNIEIADARVFGLNDQDGAPAVTVKPGATAKFHGAGTLKVGKLVATGDAGLDFSDIPVDRQTAFVDGDIEIDRGMRLVLPADLEENMPYPLCTGTLIVPAAEHFVKTIRVGETDKLVELTVAGGTVSYESRSYEACVNGTYYDSLQTALDEATSALDIEVLTDCSAEVKGPLTVSGLTLRKDLELTGSASLTFAHGAAISVQAGRTLTVGVPVVLDGFSRKADSGRVIFDGAVGGCGTNVVYAGEVDFGGAITGTGKTMSILICGRGASADEMPVITLKENCTVSAGARVLPVIGDPATLVVVGGDKIIAPAYGKVVQAGATVDYSEAGCGLMTPYGGEGRYVVESGLFNAGNKRITLQIGSADQGRFIFEQNGGTVTVGDFNMNRRGVYDDDPNRYHYILNGGTLNGTFVGTTGPNKRGFRDTVRFEMNGGTYNVKGNDTSKTYASLIYTEGCVNPVVNGDVTIGNATPKTTIVASALLNGTGSLTFAGPGTLDLTAVTDFTGDFAATGGTLLLGGDLIGEATTLRASGTGKFGLAFEGEKDIKTYYVGGRQKTIGYAYGVNAHGAARFVATEPAGAVRLLEGKDETGALLLVR